MLGLSLLKTTAFFKIFRFYKLFSFFAVSLRFCCTKIFEIQRLIELNITLRHSNAFYKAYKNFNGVLVIKLMPLSVFYNQNKRVCTNTVSHNVLLMGLGGFSFGESYFKMPPYLLMSLNKLFTIKQNPKRWHNALKPYCLRFLKDIKVLIKLVCFC
ncbi:hypothetical protein N402_04950 [Helicobacter pylori FD423]|nr:hypothetical protein N402_04950 [Helicobacter pylori FD423]